VFSGQPPTPESRILEPLVARSFSCEENCWNSCIVRGVSRADAWFERSMSELSVPVPERGTASQLSSRTWHGA